MDELNVKANIGTISTNLESLKAEAQEIANQYAGVVVTDPKSAKKDLADMRRYRKDIDDKRKEVKKKWNIPYTDFETQIKDCLKPIDEAITEIDVQLQAFEEKRKSDKKEICKKIFTEETANISEYINFDDIFMDQWLNATYSEQDIKNDIQTARLSVEKDIETIKNMHSEIEDDCMKAYVTGGLSAAVNKNQMYISAKAQAEVKAKADEEKRIAEIEEKAKAEAEAKAQAEMNKRAAETQIETPARESSDIKSQNTESYPEHSVAIAVYPVGTQLDDLIGFLLNNGIKYTEL